MSLSLFVLFQLLVAPFVVPAVIKRQGAVPHHQIDPIQNSGSSVGEQQQLLPPGVVLKSIQSAAYKVGINLQSRPRKPSLQPKTVDLSAQLTKLKEQAELYNMINDMLKAETLVQEQGSVRPTLVDNKEGAAVGGVSLGMSRQQSLAQKGRSTYPNYDAFDPDYEDHNDYFQHQPEGKKVSDHSARTGSWVGGHP